MKFFHTADWHLGKLVQGVYMTEDQRFVLNQFTEAVKQEKPDAVIIAGDLYDRAVPPTEAIDLLDEVLRKIVIEYKIPVIAVAGNHDSPGRLQFGSQMMNAAGYYMVGEFSDQFESIVLHDEFGEVHFHLVPYAEPGKVRYVLQKDEIRTYDEAMEATVERIQENMDHNARHVFVGHAFVTPYGEKAANTSESERPLSMGGTEYVSADHFSSFHYTALGHLHQAHYVKNETIRYAGSPLKYSISEEKHNKVFYIVELDEQGQTNIEKRALTPKRDMYTIEGKLEEIEQMDKNEDYVFVRLLDETPVLSPMERVRTVFPNAMHVERKISMTQLNDQEEQVVERSKMDELSLFKAFYKEVRGTEVTGETEKQFTEVLQEMLQVEGERK
ncbi:exonuclease SbcCD subunit D [Chengkuizengella axinellae]|uniref:Nuclease SbcCD subunit D n=1 Tax=Chengkuizengella axinellae TaxID=3064388 RepID=A0ABT9J1B9_9BACL|nr:exonuclease SbcCD subunit D [Chengkuizengella sp. 2205SS18-9]MDP5275375.1 exonuclease SbcCD subunit D [Chengkuizengella sp. 2205SS18-9]